MKQLLWVLSPSPQWFFVTHHSCCKQSLLYWSTSPLDDDDPERLIRERLALSGSAAERMTPAERFFWLTRLEPQTVKTKQLAIFIPLLTWGKQLDVTGLTEYTLCSKDGPHVRT